MAQNTLYPLLYKPGIKRDGTLFQADFCTNAQWIRFQRGTIKKMGSMKGITNRPQGDPINSLLSVTNITLLPESGDNTNMKVFVANHNTITNGIMTQNFALTHGYEVYETDGESKIWKSEIIIQNNKKKIVYLASYNETNINSSSEAILIQSDLAGIGNNLVNLTNPPKLTGISGLLYASSYLFVYGSNGLVQWSKLTDPLDFSNAQNRSITISNDQVVDAKSIRGGTNTPTILFWTLSSVVRCINTPDAGGNLQFQVDILSKSSSILSTRCVVEYDGLFFWPGTNRFFQYNGLVQELSNTMNLNYFYDNLDMNRRQQVVGVKNTKYGEIWWFYPERIGAPSRNPNIPEGLNSRAIIYNIRENAWYDTEISRSAAVYSEDFGFMASYGIPISAPVTENSSLFRHEFENLTPNPFFITEEYSPGGDGNKRIIPITSRFTSPVFSWAAFNPMKQLTGNDKWMYLITIEPDFILMPDNPDLQVTINVKQYAQNEAINSIIYTIPPTGPLLANPLNAKIDTSFQGRHMTLTFTSTISNFEMGHIMLSLGIGDGK